MTCSNVPASIIKYKPPSTTTPSDLLIDIQHLPQPPSPRKKFQPPEAYRNAGGRITTVLLQMSPSEPQPSVAHASSALTDSAELKRLRTFTGNYYRVLGWVDLVSSVISLAIVYWTGHVAITFGFILWFWLGNGLKQGSSSARKWAITSSIVMMTLLVVGLILPRIGLKLAPWGIDQTHPAFLPLAGIVLIVLAVPTVMLLGENGRRAFTTNKKGEQEGVADRPSPAALSADSPVD